MDMQLLAGLIALSIGVIGVTGCIVKYTLRKLSDLWDTDDEGYF